MDLVPSGGPVYQVSMQAGRFSPISPTIAAADGGLVAQVLAMRRATMRLAEPLEVEDWVVQSMPDASPVKWHLAHTTWFFERFVLRPLGIAPIHEAYDYLFNSYYESVGSRHPRARRGMLTRPTVREIIAYRAAVDARIADLSGTNLAQVAAALELGKHHEEQHQELLLTDLKHLLGENPLFPAYSSSTSSSLSSKKSASVPLSWHQFGGGVASIGFDARTQAEAFSFDNERPRHKVYVAPFELGSRLVTCEEYLAFIEDDGYRKPELWLSEGWAWVSANAVRAPMYWDLEMRALFTLHGKRAIAMNEPVCHVTYYEADAFARWSNARLPREAEWEIVATPTTSQSQSQSQSSPSLPSDSSHFGSFAEDKTFHPQPARGGGIAQILGDAWEWTQSAYEPYPGFAPLPGAFGEYNGKFMVSQMILRGGSCATPRDHIRTTYRNFFPPNTAWQFTGIRLARDVRLSDDVHEHGTGNANANEEEMVT